MKTRLRVLRDLCGYFVFVIFVALLALFVAPGHAQEAPDRSTPPAIGPAPALTVPPIEKRTLSNGVDVWLVEAREVPLVQVNLLIPVGSGADPVGQFGLASLTAAMLDEGAGSRSALEIADAIDFLGAVLTTSSSFDASAVRMNVPVARLEAALPIMADVALRPTFPEAELDRLRQERITALLQARDDPAQVAPMTFSRVVFGESHRYGTGAIGTAATLKAFTTKDLRAFHEAMYRPAHATLVVVGDMTADRIMPLLEKHFGGWTGEAPSLSALPEARQLPDRQVYIVNMPGAEQSQIRIGWVGVPRTTPDYFTLQVLNTILGGSFTSRLNQNLRERNQFTYGAGSRFDMRAAAGPFFAAAGVQTDKTAPALREFFNELEAIRTITPEELAKAKNYVALSFPSEFETIGNLAAQIEELIVYDLPDDYFERYVANIQAVTADEVRQAAATYIQPARFAVVIAGDREAIEQEVRALNLGPVRVLSLDEALGS